MAGKVVSQAPERSAGRKERDTEAARLRALIDSEDPGEVEKPVGKVDPVVPDPEPTAKVDPPAEEIEEEAPVSDDPPASDAPEGGKKKKADVWAAMKAQEDRFKADTKAQQDRFMAELQTRDKAMADLQAKLNPPDEVDPDVEVWNSAVRETVNPELAAIRKQVFMQNVTYSQQIASLRHTDYSQYVGDLNDPSNDLAKYLLANPSEAQKVFGDPDVGEALYQKGKFLHEASPASREAWRQKERETIYAEERAKLLKEFQGVVQKGKVDPIAPDSMMSMTNGSGGSTGGPLTDAAIKAMDRRTLQDLISRGENGEDIE